MWDVETLRAGLNFTLTTSLGDIDLFGEIVGGGDYEQLVDDAVAVQLDGLEFLCLGLQRLIAVKRAAGRPKDLEAIAELEVIRDEELKRTPGPK